MLFQYRRLMLQLMASMNDCAQPHSSSPHPAKTTHRLPPPLLQPLRNRPCSSLQVAEVGLHDLAAQFVAPWPHQVDAAGDAGGGEDGNGDGVEHADLFQCAAEAGVASGVALAAGFFEDFGQAPLGQEVGAEGVGRGMFGIVGEGGLG